MWLETVTIHVAELHPSAVAAVIVAVPALTAVTKPVLSTVAMVSSDDFHVTALFVTLPGVTVVVKVSVLPNIIKSVDLFRFTDVALTIGLFTVTVQLVVLLPSTVVAVIVAVPAPIAVIFPVLFTVAIVLSDDFHVTALFVALLGATVVTKISVLPTIIESVVLSKLKEVTLTIGLLTVTVQVAFLLPSTVVAVMVDIPAPIAVIFPVLFTVAMALFDDVHVTSLLVTFVGFIVAIKLSVPSTIKVSVVLFKLTVVAFTMIGDSAEFISVTNVSETTSDPQ